MNDDLQKRIDETNARIAPLEEARVQDRNAILKAQLKAARDEGRVDDEVEILKELARPEPKPEAKPANGFETLKTPVETWAAEVDHDGNLRRPWLAPDHPDHELAQGKLMSLVNEWQRSGLSVTPQTFPLFAQQLEAKMGKPNGATRSPAVLGTSQVRAPAKKETDLTPEQRHYADKTMAHVQDQKERYRRYAAQVALMRPR